MTWEYRGTLFNPAEHPASISATAASESAIVQLADQKTLTNVLRFDGDCGCNMASQGNECGKVGHSAISSLLLS